jgi:hypothetical protein
MPAGAGIAGPVTMNRADTTESQECADGTSSSGSDGDFDTLADLLDAVEQEAGRTGGMSIERVQAMAGCRAYGPLLLLPGLIAVSPLSGVPTVPSVIGAIVAIVSAQLMVGRLQVWLPARLRRAALGADRIRTAMRFARPVARVVDRVVHRRLAWLTGTASLRLAAAVCVVVAATMPPLEILPFMATSAGAIIALYGLALTVHDGVLLVAAHALVIAVALAGTVAFAG